MTFDIPGEYLNPELGILNVEIRQDTTVVYSTTVDTTGPRRRPFRQPYLYR